MRQSRRRTLSGWLRWQTVRRTLTKFCSVQAVSPHLACKCWSSYGNSEFRLLNTGAVAIGFFVVPLDYVLKFPRGWHQLPVTAIICKSVDKKKIIPLLGLDRVLFNSSSSQGFLDTLWHAYNLAHWTPYILGEQCQFVQDHKKNSAEGGCAMKK